MLNELIRDELVDVHYIGHELEYSEEHEIDAEKMKERFKIENIDGANWAFRKLRAIQEKETEIRELMNKEIERIQNWAKTELDSLTVSTNFFNFLLEEYYREQRALDPKFKLSTPYGKVSSRKLQPKWNYDEDKLVNWLKENDMDLVRIKYEPNKAEIKKKYKINGNIVITEDGEIVEGIAVEEQEDSISIKVVE